MMELMNVLEKSVKTMKTSDLEQQDGTENMNWRELWKKFLSILSPFAPHISEELWQELMVPTGDDFDSVHSQKWPEAEGGVEQNREVVIVVSVNGKTRGTISFSTQDFSLIGQKQIEQTAQSNDQVAKYLDSKQIKKVIYIKNRIINFVV